MVSDTLAPQTHFLGNNFLIMKLLYRLHKKKTFVTYTMRTNLPKTLDQLIFSKCSQNQLNISKFLPPKRRKTLRSY